MSLYLGTSPIAISSPSRNIGEIIQSTIPLTDAGLHLLDGAVINGAGSYAKFVNYIAGLVSNYPDLFTTESNWQSSVSTYGVCGKFVYDSTNNTVRLPKITGFTEGTIDPITLGNLTTAGLPNITGRLGLEGDNNDNQTSNAIYVDITDKASTRALTTTVSGYPNKRFDASHSSSIYGNSTTVQPQSVKVLYYIVIASSITNELNLDVADMADKDFSNITLTAQENLVDTLYPVGSCYIGVGAVCPLAAIKGTWTLQSSGIVTSVNTNVPVKGNGKALGLTDGTNNLGMANISTGGVVKLGVNTNSYGVNVGTTQGDYNGAVDKTVGVTTDASKSGIVGTVTRSTLSVNIWQRTA